MFDEFRLNGFAPRDDREWISSVAVASEFSMLKTISHEDGMICVEIKLQT